MRAQVASRAPSRCHLLIALAILLPRLVNAQTVRGRVVEALVSAPVAGALVELQDSLSRPVAHAITSSTGAFLFRLPQPGRFALRIAAIGFHPRRLEMSDVSAGGLAIPEVVIERAIITLPDLVAVGSKSHCDVSDTSTTILGALLANARNALQVIDGVWQSGSMQFDVEFVHRTVLIAAKGGEMITADTTHRPLQSWPIQSLPPDSLRSAGFGWAYKIPEGPGRVYWGPDLRVLFSDWFLASHCFSLSVAKADKGASDVHLKFEPERKSFLVDIAGEMVLDQETLAMKSLTYRHRNLPDEIPEGAAGGSMSFTQAANGAWIPMDWVIWAPIQRQPAMGQPQSRGWSVAPTLPSKITIVGREESRGRVVNVTRKEGN